MKEGARKVFRVNQQVVTKEWTQDGREGFPSREQGERSIARGNSRAYSGNWKLFALPGLWLVRDHILGGIQTDYGRTRIPC